VVLEQPRNIPVVHNCDICVIGGSSTGVFAAVRAAKMGASVAIIENNGFFGGVATASMVNVWHPLYDTIGEKQIIGGLTAQVVNKLVKRQAAQVNAKNIFFNAAELILELDNLVISQPLIRPFLHTRFCDAVTKDGRMTHAVIEDKSGRRAVAAKYFIDATGDADVIARMNLPLRINDTIQPPTTCAFIYGLEEVKKQNPGFKLADTVRDTKYPNAIKNGFSWGAPAMGCPGMRMLAGTRVENALCSDADQLTKAEFEGRRQVKAIRDIIHDNVKGGENFAVLKLPTCIGIRETRHANCLHRVTESEVLNGVRFHDAIGNGSYCVDIHYSDRPGLTFRYLNGTELYVVPGKSTEKKRWRKPIEKDPTFYQIPYRSIVPKGSQNVLVAGRMIDADKGAFGAIRVMVNCNQQGEAAGVASVIALQNNSTVAKVNTDELRKKLADGGSIII
jgi:hypothetical protein